MIEVDESESFKNRINPPGVYQAHRDSEGISSIQNIWHFLEFQILDDDNSSQNLDDEDLAQLILEAETEENEQSDEVYSSWHLFVLSIAKGITTIISVFMNSVQNVTFWPV